MSKEADILKPLPGAVEPMQVVALGTVVHVRWTPDYSEALLLDGTKVPAMAKPEDIAQRDMAMMLGYCRRWPAIEDAVRAMCWEHEVMHTLLARARGRACSLVLYDVAHHRKLTHQLEAEHHQEEAEVLALQRCLNTAEQDAGVPHLWAELDLWQFLNAAHAVLGRTRWHVLPYTSGSGRILFACTECGRISPTPDKVCSSTGCNT